MRKAGLPLLPLVLAAVIAPAAGRASQNVTVVGRVVTNLSGNPYNDALFVHDNLAFFIGSDGVSYKLEIYDVGNPAAPVLQSEIPVPGTRPTDMHGIYYSNGLLYLGITVNSPGGFYIYDVGVPSAPVLRSWNPISAGVHDLRLAGHYLYVVSDSFGSADFWVYDVADPAAPVQVNQYELNPGSSYCHDLSVMSGVGYASMWDAGLFLFDLSDPTRSPLPILARTPPPPPMPGPEWQNTHSAWPLPDLRTVVTCHEISTGGGSGGANFWDVGAVPFARLGHYESHQTDPTTIIHDVMVVGRFAYISHYPEGLRILDLSSPTLPVELGSLITGSPCANFCSAIAQWVEDGLVYLLDEETGLWIVSFDLPHDAPITLYAVKTGGAQDVSLSWNFEGESQYTVRRYLDRKTVAAARNRDVDGDVRYTDAGAIPAAPPNAPLFYYKINGPWR